MTGRAAVGLVDITNRGERCRGGGMTTQAKGYGLQAMGMGMSIKIGSMTVDTFTGAIGCTAGQGPGSCIMTGSTVAGIMNFTGTNEW